MDIIIHTVDNKIQNTILTAIDTNITREIEVPHISMNASFGPDLIISMENSEHGEHVGTTVPFENVSGRNNTLHELNTNHETRRDSPDKVNELSVSVTHYDRQPHIHHMVTRQTAQTNQILQFLTGCILTPINPPSHQHQNLSTQISLDSSFSMVEKTSGNRKSESKKSISHLVEAISGFVNQQ